MSFGGYNRRCGLQEARKREPMLMGLTMAYNREKKLTGMRVERRFNETSEQLTNRFLKLCKKTGYDGFIQQRFSRLIDQRWGKPKKRKSGYMLRKAIE